MICIVISISSIGTIIIIISSSSSMIVIVFTVRRHVHRWGQRPLHSREPVGTAAGCRSSGGSSSSSS